MFEWLQEAWDWVSDLMGDIDGTQLLIVAGMWLICSFLLFKSGFWALPQKIILSVMMAPIIFVIVKIMANR